MVVPELLLLKAPLHLVSLLFSWAFNIIISLRSFYSDHDDDLCPDQPTGGEQEEEDQEQFTDNPKFQLLSSLLIIQELLLPSTLLYDHNTDRRDPCAVCLCEFEAGEQIRKLTNCRHVFHRWCLDGCIEHEHTTCPLCRASSIFSDEMEEALMMMMAPADDGDGEGYYYLDRVLAAAGIPDAGGDGGGGDDHHATDSLVPLIFRH